MPRAVMPWTWRRALRDFGPRNPAELLTCYTIGTFMDRDGFAFPSQQTIAQGIRASVRTAQRHLTSIERQGWVGVVLAGRGGQGWRHHAYRACVPDHINLDALDEKMADIVLSESGDVPEPRDIALSSPSPRALAERGDTAVTNVATKQHRGDDTGRQKVATELCRTNSGSETLASRTHAPEEAQSEDCVASSLTKVEESLREQRSTSVPTEGFAKKVLHEGLSALPQRPGSSLRRISDEQLARQLDRLAASGMDSVNEASRVLSGNYVDVGVDRLWRVIKQRRQQERGVVV